MANDKPITDDAQLSELGYRPELRRVLGLFSSCAVQFSLIAVTGSIFLLYGYGLSTGGPAFIWPFIVGGVFQVIVGLSMAELVSAFPLAGGSYQIARKLGRPVLGWQMGWWLVVAHLAAMAANAVALAPYFASAMGINNINKGQILLFSVGLIGFVTILNIVGVKLSAFANNVGVICELVGISSVVIVLLIKGVIRSPSFLTSTGGVAPHGYFVPFLFVLLMPAFIISSFDSTGNMAEEVKDAARKAPRGVVTANVSALVYATVAMIILTLSITSLSDVTGSSIPLMAVLHERLGHLYPQIFEVVAITSLIVTTQILQLTAARILWSQARDKQLPASGWFHKLSAKGKVPVNATIVTAVIALLLTLWSPFLTALAALTAIGWAAVYGLTVLAGIIAKRRGQLPDHPWKYGRIGNVLDVVSVLWSAVLVGVLTYQSPREAGLGFVIVVVVGIVLYYVAVPRGARSSKDPLAAAMAEVQVPPAGLATEDRLVFPGGYGCPGKLLVMSPSERRVYV
jgi:amino acid transporter